MYTHTRTLLGLQLPSKIHLPQDGDIRDSWGVKNQARYWGFHGHAMKKSPMTLGEEYHSGHFKVVAALGLKLSIFEMNFFFYASQLSSYVGVVGFG